LELYNILKASFEVYFQVFYNIWMVYLLKGAQTCQKGIAFTDYPLKSDTEKSATCVHYVRRVMIHEVV